MNETSLAGEPDEIVALRIERDICALFHRYATSDGLVEMFEFEALYTLPYWDYLDFAAVGLQRRSFICEGCLMLILRLARECPLDLEPAHRRKLGLCRAAIERVDLRADRPRRLAQFALLLLDATERRGAIKESELDELEALENEVLGEYFGRLAKRFGKPAPATQVSLARYVAQADEARRRMLDARSGTAAAADYNEVKESLAEAIALARQMELPEAVEELERQRERTRTLFRSRFA